MPKATLTKEDILDCSLCQATGCIGCLDTHQCEDYYKEDWIR